MQLFRDVLASPESTAGLPQQVSLLGQHVNIRADESMPFFLVLENNHNHPNACMYCSYLDEYRIPKADRLAGIIMAQLVNEKYYSRLSCRCLKGGSTGLFPVKSSKLEKWEQCKSLAARSSYSVKEKVEVGVNQPLH